MFSSPRFALIQSLSAMLIRSLKGNRWDSILQWLLVFQENHRENLMIAIISFKFQICNSSVEMFENGQLNCNVITNESLKSPQRNKFWPRPCTLFTFLNSMTSHDFVQTFIRFPQPYSVDHFLGNNKNLSRFERFAPYSCRVQGKNSDSSKNIEILVFTPKVYELSRI